MRPILLDMHGFASFREPRTPAQLFDEYCATRGVTDPRVAALFARLHDEVTASGAD